MTTNLTLKDFLFDLLIIGFTIEKGGVSFSGKNIEGIYYRIQPAETGGWEIGQVNDQWAKTMHQVEPIESFHQKYFAALTGV